MNDSSMKLYILLPIMFLAAVVHAAPTLSGSFPANDAFTKGGTINFSVNASSATLDSSNVVLFVISKSAYDQGESWDRYVMQCGNYTVSDWKCNRTVSFAIAGSDTPELFYFEANDTGGSNLGTAASPLRFTLDRSPPSISILAPQSNSYVSSNVTVQISASDTASGVNDSTLQFSLDNATWNNFTGGKGYWSSIAYADNTSIRIYVRAKDNVANGVETSINVSTDNEMPKILIISPANGSSIAGSYTFQATVNDTYSGINTGSVSVRFANSNFGMTCVGTRNFNCSVAIDTSVYADNTYNVTFSVLDAANNPNNATISMSTKNSKPTVNLLLQEGFLKGTVAINVSITKPEGIISNVTLALENGNVVPVGKMDCSSDFTSCTYIMDTARFPDGAKTLAATAGNSLGYSLKSSVSVNIDNTKPTITINTPQIVKGAWDITATVTDENPHEEKVAFKVGSYLQTMFCTTQAKSLDCKSKYDSNLLSDGPKVLEITASDKLGNSFTASKNVSIDNKPPEFRFIKIDPIYSKGPKEIEFTVGLEDAGSSVKVAQATIKHPEFSATLDMINASDVWYGKATIVSYGSHKVGIKAEDQSGNSVTYDEKGYFYIGPLSCGDGICQTAENSCLCADDCSGLACSGGQVTECSTGIPVCAPPPICGNDLCSSSESCISCSTDCGTCEAIASAEKMIEDKKKSGKNETLGTGSGAQPGAEAEARSLFAPIIGFVKENPLVAITLVTVVVMLILLFALRKKRPQSTSAGQSLYN